MLTRIFKIVIGIALIPACWGITGAFYNLLCSIQSFGRAETFFLWGAIAYLLLYAFLFKLNYIYVFGHEAVHALFAMLFGGKVRSFRASSKGGSVGVTRSNFIISLAPYFFPVYTVLLGIIFVSVELLFQTTFQQTNLFIFLIGFSACFHFVMTANTLKTQQPDLTENGYIFSLTLIYIMNILVLAGMLSLIFKNISWVVFLKEGLSRSRQIIGLVIEQLFSTGA
ncbi:MAG: M50 family metallopeptidase [Candidatus Omnitrophica bacterium]|nr:M50 family metallopeptidase [Candidatus Omnitrophota bacterium]MBU1925358.1 M50 family metallopeptidase [Candidatus Omnitrophota bacterium]